VRSVKNDRKPCWLTLMGKKGTGKTHCARRVWTFLYTHFELGRHPSLFDCRYTPRSVYWPAEVDELRGGDESSKREFREMQKWPALSLDDIGAERDTSGFAAEKLNLVLGCRVGAWTVITSNLNLEQIGKIEPRIADRIVREPGNQFIEIDTMSYSMRKTT
jgi:hypothetical protein